MASFYSSFFSSGLLAPHPADGVPADASRSTTPVADPSTPRPVHKALDDTTPTSNNVAGLLSSASSNNVLPALTAQAADRPRLRRRRSSLGVAASPVAAIKASTQGARSTASVRQSLAVASPNRTRSGSVTESVLVSRVAAMTVANDATKSTSLIGRLRSGSVGAALRPRRTRRNVTVPIPAPPPPSMPLPAVPPLDHLRRPTNRRNHTADPIPQSHAPKPLSGGERMNMGSPLASGAARSLSLDAQAMKFDAQRDYPSPLDTPSSIRDEYFGSDVVMAL